AANWNSSGSLLFTKDNYTIKIWDAITGKHVNEIYLGTAMSTDSLLWAAEDDGFIVVSTANRKLFLLSATGTRREGYQVPLANRVVDLDSTKQLVVDS